MSDIRHGYGGSRIVGASKFGYSAYRPASNLYSVRSPAQSLSSSGFRSPVISPALSLGGYSNSRTTYRPHSTNYHTTTTNFPTTTTTYFVRSPDQSLGLKSNTAYSQRPNQTNYPTTTTTLSTRKKSVTTTTSPIAQISTEDTPFCSGNITLFSSNYHRGENITLVDIKTHDLGSMNNKTVSVKVEGDCCWRLFMEPQFTGQSKLVSSQETYISVTSLGELRRKVSSVRQEACYKWYCQTRFWYLFYNSLKLTVFIVHFWKYYQFINIQAKLS